MPLDRWLVDRSIFAEPIGLSLLQHRAMLHAERVLYPETFDELGWPHVRNVSQLAFAWGKGAGKDFLSRLMLSRGVYLLWCLVSPQAYFHMPSTETIHLTNIALAAYQAKSVFFDPWVRQLRASRFFRRIIEPKINSITFDKNIVATSGHSQVASQEGQNLIMSVLDEFAEFKTANELLVKSRLTRRMPQQSAEGIYKMVMSSTMSRFPRTGKVIAISYTRFKDDPIDSLVREAEEMEGPHPDRYVSRAPTWVVNPNPEVTRESLQKEYDRDPGGFAALYECNPEGSAYQYFRNMLAVRRALGVLDPKIKPKDHPADPTIGVRYYWGTDPKVGEPEQTIAERLARAPSWRVEYDFSALRKHKLPMAIHLDLGLNHDLCGIAASHIEGVDTRTEPHVNKTTGLVTEREFFVPKVITDFVIYLEQQMGDIDEGIPRQDVKVDWVRQLMVELINAGWVLGRFTADNFQSVALIQAAQNMGIESERVSTDKNTEAYDTLKELVYDDRIRAPFHPLLYNELDSLVKLSDIKIDHPDGGSKDLADAWAGSAVGAMWLAEERGWNRPGRAWPDYAETVQAQQMSQWAYSEAADFHEGLGGVQGAQFAKQMEEFLMAPDDLEPRVDPFGGRRSRV